MDDVTTNSDEFYPAFVDDEESTVRETVVIRCLECPGDLLFPWDPSQKRITCCGFCGTRFNAKLRD